jgi:hypothetical protein
MKRILISVFIMAAACQAYAFEWGAGYDNGGTAARFRWDDTFTSELSVQFSYTNTPGSSQPVNAMTVINIDPMNTLIYKNDIVRINGGVVLTDVITYIKNASGIGGGLDANQYGFYILAPEAEFSLPWVKGLTLIGSIKAGFSWAYSSATQKPTQFTASIRGVTLANVGIIYYFGGDDAAPQTAQKPQELKTRETENQPRAVPATLGQSSASRPVYVTPNAKPAGQGTDENADDAENN